MKDGRLDVYWKHWHEEVDRVLEQAIPPVAEPAGPLAEAMRYSLLAGGKRVRPLLVIAATEAVGGVGEMALPVAAAFEMIHTYSLIHDDLPAMDNDDLRRGRPTCHKVYGEAMAILAGDALLTRAFEVLADSDLARAMKEESWVLLVREVAHAAGAPGMVGGQAADILSEGRAVDRETLSYVHTHKTGALIRAAVRAGGMVGGASGEALDAVTRYGGRLGLAFQIVDDILNVEGDEAQTGKPVGSDAKRQKVTYPALIGLDTSRNQAEQLIREAIGALLPLGKVAWALRAIAEFIRSRKA